jgi:hypothetical protein
MSCLVATIPKKLNVFNFDKDAATPRLMYE